MVKYHNLFGIVYCIAGGFAVTIVFRGLCWRSVFTFCYLQSCVIWIKLLEWFRIQKLLAVIVRKFLKCSIIIFISLFGNLSFTSMNSFFFQNKLYSEETPEASLHSTLLICFCQIVCDHRLDAIMSMY